MISQTTALCKNKEYEKRATNWQSFSQSFTNWWQKWDVEAQDNAKGKFFSEDITMLVTLPIFANKHFTAPEHFSVHRHSKMFAKIGNLTSSIISSEKNLPLHICILKRCRVKNWK